MFGHQQKRPQISTVHSELEQCICHLNFRLYSHYYCIRLWKNTFLFPCASRLISPINLFIIFYRRELDAFTWLFNSDCIKHEFKIDYVSFKRIYFINSRILNENGRQRHLVFNYRTAVTKKFSYSRESELLFSYTSFFRTRQDSTVTRGNIFAEFSFRSVHRPEAGCVSRSIILHQLI